MLFAALLVPFSYFNHSDGWNQTARLAELHAVVVRKTLRIDAYHEITGDKALIDGHYYSEKAPAIVAAALPSFALTVFAQRLAGVDPDSPSAWRVSEWISTSAAVGAITAVGGVAFFALLESRLGTSAALLSTFAFFFGTLAFPYATSMFAHAGTIGFLAIALWGTLGARAPARDFIAGLAAGLAVASEYPAVFSCGVIGLYLGYLDRGRMWRFGLATLPALALILANNYAISGSPFQLSYGSNPVFPEMTTGNLMGFQLPRLERLSALLFSEYRGLFFWSPVLLLALPGMRELYRRDRPGAILIAAAFFLTLLQVAAFYNWSGGNSFGPRYLAPALPFVGVAAAYGIKRFPEMGLVLTVVAIALTGMVTAIAIDPPSDVMTPLRSFYFARIEQGRFADNLGTLLGAPLWLSLVVPIAMPAAAAWFVMRRRVVHD
jgi:hypothetical protein